MRTEIIPYKQQFYKNGNESGLDLKAICIFSALGFFLGRDTYYKNLEALQPASDYNIDETGNIISAEEYWKWHYSPREMNLKQATEEFADLFEKLIHENLKDKKVIMPLSGGIDSRSQAAAIGNKFDTKSYSYKFEKSFDETKYGRLISEVLGIPYKEYVIPEGYLWDVIDELAEINQCYADFTHPRQMAVIKEVSKFGDVFFLGHWGDVLFDSMGVDEELRFDELVNTVLTKIVKKGGIELAEMLWEHWELEGKFRNYLEDRISELLSEIKIDNANSRIRAFKSMYWAPRWTSANMNVFSNFHPIFLPYYENEMCEFICNIPEDLLAGRKIQIEYIKMKNPELAKIPWQSYEPLNLYNYKNFQNIGNLPGRVVRKVNRIINEDVLKKKKTKSNYEIQFLGKNNDSQLKKRLFENDDLKNIIPEKIVKDIYGKFINEDSKKYSHPVSMLLTISQFSNSLSFKQRESE